MRVRVWVTSAVLGLCAATIGHAQMAEDKPPVPVGQAMNPAKALDEMLTVFEAEAMAVAKAMPADKYGFAPNAAAFTEKTVKYDGVRTFASEVAHVAQANYYFYMTASGIKPDADMRAVGTLTTKDECVKALADSFAFGHKALATVTAANAFESIKGADGIHTRVTVADFAVAHGYVQYGKMVEYLRII